MPPKFQVGFLSDIASGDIYKNGAVSPDKWVYGYFFLLLEITKYISTSVTEVLAHASDLEIAFGWHFFQECHPQIQHFSSGSLSATNVSQAEHKCH